MKCAWPKACEEKPVVQIGMLLYCMDHAIEVDKNRTRIIAEYGK